jgi:hypothetical protein
VTWEVASDPAFGAGTILATGQVRTDPATDHTSGADNGVAGVVVGGNASTTVHGYYYMTSPIINAAGATKLYLGFWRWLNTDYTPYMVNTVEVFDGTQCRRV